MTYSQKAVVNNLREKVKKLEDKLKAIKNYIVELEGTGSFVDKQKIMNIIESDEID